MKALLLAGTSASPKTALVEAINRDEAMLKQFSDMLGAEEM